MTKKNLLIVALVSFLLFTIYIILMYKYFNNFTERGQFWDMFWAFNWLFALLSFIAVIYSLHLQQKEITEQQKLNFDIEKQKNENLQIQKKIAIINWCSSIINAKWITLPKDKDRWYYINKVTELIKEIDNSIQI
jgi:cell division protein FtsB